MALKILFFALVGTIVIPLCLKETPKDYLKWMVTILLVFQALFIPFHPLLGIICLVLCSFVAIVCYMAMKNDDDLPVHVSILYISLFLGSLSLLTEFVETFSGRLF